MGKVMWKRKWKIGRRLQVKFKWLTSIKWKWKKK